jgi:hypothetical protein
MKKGKKITLFCHIRAFIIHKAVGSLPLITPCLMSAAGGGKVNHSTGKPSPFTAQ